MVNIRYFTNPLKTGDIMCIHKQCVPGFSSGGGGGGGGGEGPGNKATVKD